MSSSHDTSQYRGIAIHRGEVGDTDIVNSGNWYHDTEVSPVSHNTTADCDRQFRTSVPIQAMTPLAVPTTLKLKDDALHHLTI